MLYFFTFIYVTFLFNFEKTQKTVTRKTPVQRLRVIPPHQAPIPLREEPIKMLPDNQTFQYRRARRRMFKRPIQETIVRISTF